MILIEAIDPARSRADFVAYRPDQSGARDEFARLAGMAGRLGFKDLSLRMADGTAPELSAYVGNEPGPTVASGLTAPLGLAAEGAVATMLEFRFLSGLQDERPFYELGLERRPDALEVLGRTLGLLLATFGPIEEDLLRLRIALVEGCARIIDHAEPLGRIDSGVDPLEMRIRLRYQEAAIEGEIEDGCEPFDPTSVGGLHLSRVSVERFDSGDGADLIETLLDEYEHRITSLGNNLRFMKRIEA